MDEQKAGERFYGHLCPDDAIFVAPLQGVTVMPAYAPDADAKVKRALEAALEQAWAEADENGYGPSPLRLLPEHIWQRLIQPSNISYQSDEMEKPNGQ